MARPPTPSSLIKTLCSLAQPLAAAASDRHDRPGGPARQKLTAATRKRKEDGASSDAILFDQNLVLAGSALGGSSLFLLPGALRGFDDQPLLDGIGRNPDI